MILGLLRDHKIYKYILYIIYIYLPFNRGVANLFRLFLNIEVSECILFWDWISTKAWMSSPLPNYVSKTFETPPCLTVRAWKLTLGCIILFFEHPNSRAWSVQKLQYSKVWVLYGWIFLVRKLAWRGSVRERVCDYDLPYATICFTKH